MLSKAAKFVVSSLMIFSGCRVSPPLSMEGVRNAVYDLPMAGKITFTNGEYERAPNDSLGQSYLHVGLIDLFAFGDLNGDRAEDALTFLAQSTGGPEIYVSMEIFTNIDGMASHAASYIVGDRVGIDSVTIAQGIIHLYVITQGPDDAICCPTLHVTRKLRLQHRGSVVLTDP